MSTKFVGGIFVVIVSYFATIGIPYMIKQDFVRQHSMANSVIIDETFGLRTGPGLDSLLGGLNVGTVGDVEQAHGFEGVKLLLKLHGAATYNNVMSRRLGTQSDTDMTAIVLKRGPNGDVMVMYPGSGYVKTVPFDDHFSKRMYAVIIDIAQLRLKRYRKGLTYSGLPKDF